MIQNQDNQKLSLICWVGKYNINNVITILTNLHVFLWEIGPEWSHDMPKIWFLGSSILKQKGYRGYGRQSKAKNVC